MTDWFDDAASLLLGSRCPGCGTSAARLCPRCLTVLGAATPAALALGEESPVVACAAYDEPWRGCLISFKERGAWWLAGPLADVMALGVATLLKGEQGRRRSSGALILVPVPSDPGAVRRRGWDTTRGLARAVAWRLTRAGVPAAAAAVLRLTRPVADQAGLSSASRVTNLAGAHAAQRAPSGPVIVVDDLTTTGASLREARRALGSRGCDVWGSVVVAATPRRG